MSQKYKIAVKDYEWECGESCCSEYGREWYINGELVYRGSCEEDAYLIVLKKLGIDAELVGLDKNGKEVWSL